MKTILMSLILGITMIGAQGCGNSAVNIDPLTLFSDSSIPALDSILPVSSAYTALALPFSSANPYWTFNTGSFYGTTTVAPASGIVTEVGTAAINGASVSYVTIAHSGRLSTRIYGVNNLTARPGDSVVRGQTMGSFITIGLGYVGLQVLLDGAPICPLSFISSQFRALLYNTAFLAGTYAAQVCQQ